MDALTTAIDVAISQKYKSVKEFSEEVDIAYTTLKTALKKGFGGTSVNTVLKICSHLGIDINNYLDTAIEDVDDLLLEAAEKELLEKYRCLDENEKEAVKVLIEAVYEKSVLKQGLLVSQSVKKTDKGTLVHKPEAYRTSHKYPANVVVLEDYSDAPEDTTTIPVYDAGASAGTGIFLDSDCYDVIAIPDNYTSRKANFAVWVDGHSMEPRFNDGDLVLVRTQPAVDIGEIGIFIVNGEGFIKKLGEGELISLNPDYENIQLNEWDDISCKGRVLGKL